MALVLSLLCLLEVRHKYAVLFMQFLHYTNNISLCFADLD